MYPQTRQLYGSLPSGRVWDITWVMMTPASSTANKETVGDVLRGACGVVIALAGSLAATGLDCAPRYLWMELVWCAMANWFRALLKVPLSIRNSRLCLQFYILACAKQLVAGCPELMRLDVN